MNKVVIRAYGDPEEPIRCLFYDIIKESDIPKTVELFFEKIMEKTLDKNFIYFEVRSFDDSKHLYSFDSTGIFKDSRK